MFFPYVDYWLCSVAQTRKDIERRVSASFKGIRNEAFPVKILAFKIFIFILCTIRHFCQNFKNSCFILFIVLSKAHSNCFIFNKVIHITVKVPSIRIALSIGSLNVGGSPQIFINISVCKSSNLINRLALMSYTIVH